MTATPPLPRPIRLEEFTPLIGKPLLADCDPNAVALHLVEATALRDHGQVERPPFILIFRSSLSALLTTGIYTMRGDGFGPDLIQISQIAAPFAGEPGHYYQAVFN